MNPDYKIGERRIGRERIEFADLIPLAIQIVNSSDVARNAIRNAYTDVFLDEFQDCIDQQYKLIKCAFMSAIHLLIRHT